MKKLILLIGMLAVIHSSFGQDWLELKDRITFETPDSLSFIENWPGNSFQIGIPTKIFFDSAWSAPNALVTDMHNPYPVNNNSAFTIKIYDPSWQWQFPGATIVYEHKYDTDSLHDGGYLMISVDGGNSWVNVSTVYTQTGFYYDPEHYANPLIADGNAAYTGKSRKNNSQEFGWRTDEISFCIYFQEKVYLRFVFSSDSLQTNKEGWMIDNIEIYQEVCEGINEIRNNNLIVLAPNPASDQLTILHSKPGSHKEISIIDPTGKICLHDENFSGNKIDIHKLPVGIYMLRYSDGDSFCMKKFIVARK